MINAILNKSHLLKEGMITIVGQAFMFFGAVAGVTILTEFLDPSSYGQLALAMTVITFFSSLIFGPMNNGILRFYAPAKSHRKTTEYFSSVRNLVIIATFASFVLILLSLIILIFLNQTDTIDLFLLACCLAILMGYNSTFNSIQNGNRNRIIVAYHQGIENWFKFLIAALFIMIFGSDSSIVLAGYITAFLILIISQTYFFNKKFSILFLEDYNKEWSSKILHYSLPFTYWGIFSWARSVSDRWALQYFTTEHEVGLYSVLFQLGYFPISVGGACLIQFITPILYQISDDATKYTNNKRTSKISATICLIIIIISILSSFIAYLIHKEIFIIFTNEKYWNVSIFLPFMIMSGGLRVAAQSLSISLFSKMKTNEMIFSKISTAIFGVVISIIGAKLYGLKGVVYASLIFSSCDLLWVSFLSIKYWNSKAARE